MSTILVVDDDKTNLIIARKALSEDFKVVAVTSAAQGLEYLKMNTPDLILLDINMPEMDGFEMNSVLKADEKLALIPVVFLTADTDEETKEKCLNAGGVDCITKPFIIKALKEKIVNMVERFK